MQHLKEPEMDIILKFWNRERKEWAKQLNKNNQWA